jgi:hypothetical protein
MPGLLQGLNTMKKFNWSIFLYSAILVGFLIVSSFIAAGAEDEGTLGSGMIGMVLSKLFYILRFPTHTLFWNFFSSDSNHYFGGLLINCLFYGLIVERIAFVIKFQRQKRSGIVEKENLV